MIKSYKPYSAEKTTKPLGGEVATDNTEMALALLNRPDQTSQAGNEGGGMPSMNPSMFMKNGGMFGGSSSGGATSGGASSSGGMGALGSAAAIAAAIAATKGYEHRNPDSTFSKTFGRFNAPTLNQVKADPKTALTGILTGAYPLMYDKMNREAKAAKPEWEEWLGY